MGTGRASQEALVAAGRSSLHPNRTCLAPESPDNRSPGGPGLGLLVPAALRTARAAAPTHRGSRAGTPPAALHCSPALSRQGNCGKRRQTQQVPRNGRSYPGILKRQARSGASGRGWSWWQGQSSVWAGRTGALPSSVYCFMSIS